MKKRALSLILAVVMVLGIVPFSSVVANAEDTTTKKMELGTSGVADRDFVYYGNYKSEDIKWKVLDADADNAGEAQGMFLLSEYLLERNNKPFDADTIPNAGQTNSNEWQGSDAQDWCKTFADSDAFTASEKEALKSVSKSDAETTQYGILWRTSSLAEEKVFYLSAEEAATYIGANGGDEGLVATTSGTAAGGWWLRSPYDFYASGAGFVYEDGNVYNIPVDDNFSGVRPALNLNLESVLFSSAAVGGKSSGTVGAAALNSVPAYTSDTARAWKVTLLDTNRTFTAQAAEGTTASAATGYSNWSVDVTYNNAATDTNEYVSAMLCDASGNVLYYGNIAQNSASGTQTVNIPTGLGVGNYTLKVFSEQLNGDNKTDYASAMQDIALEVTLPKPAATPSATFTATSENGGTLTDVTTTMSYSVDGGANWITVTDTTMNIADVTAANGVQIYDKGDGVATSDSDVQTITVTQAAQPTGLSKTDCTTSAANDGKINGVSDAMEYKVATDTAWTLITGNSITGLTNTTYDVRTKASKAVLASAGVSFSLTALQATPDAVFRATSENGGTLTGVTTNMSYSVDGGTNWMDVTDTTMNIADVTVANGVQVYDKGDGVATSASDVQTITVTQAAQPTGLSKTDCSAAGNDGAISSVDNSMEYKVSGSNTWTAVTDTTITGLSTQTYLVRIKASGTMLASKPQSITLGYLGADYSGVDAAINRANDLTKTNYKDFSAVETAINAVVTGYDITRQDEVAAFATAINEAIEALAYKDADYSKVTEAINKIPADLSSYTDASVKALNEAKSAVDYNKNITEQAAVDTYAANIENAILTLKYKSAVFTKVNEALAKVPADLTLYTDDSVKKLKNAINAVEKDKNITEQTTVDAYAVAIEKAIKNLQYKAADYSKVDEAIKKIPADLSNYTDASVKVLNNAKAAVIRSKNITEQATVDGYATAIQKAIDGLKKKAVNVDQGKTSPQTGDNSNMLLWWAIFMLCAGGIAIVGITRKTRKKHSKQ